MGWGNCRTDATKMKYDIEICETSRGEMHLVYTNRDSNVLQSMD